jgi:hypothetical protein
MWPNALGVGAGEVCKITGSHKWAVPRNLGKSQTSFIRFCRRCNEKIVVKFDEKSGKIEERIYKST